MPTPNKNETEEKFVSRCIAYVIKEKGKDQKQAAGECYGIWREHRKEETIKQGIKNGLSKDQLKELIITMNKVSSSELKESSDVFNDIAMIVKAFKHLETLVRDPVKRQRVHQLLDEVSALYADL